VIIVTVVGLLSDNELRSLKCTGGLRLPDIRLWYKPRFRTLEILTPNPSFVRRIRTFVHSWRTNISSYRTVALSNCVPTCIFCPLNTKNADPSVRAIKGVGLRPLACRDDGFKSHRGYGRLSLVSVVCCQVQFSATGWSPVRRSPTKCNQEAPKMRRPRPTRAVEPWKKNAIRGTQVSIIWGKT
jgi:hypothetical protein